MEFRVLSCFLSSTWPCQNFLRRITGVCLLKYLWSMPFYASGRPIPEPKEYSFKDWPLVVSWYADAWIHGSKCRQDLHDGTGGFSASNRPNFTLNRTFWGLQSLQLGRYSLFFRKMQCSIYIPLLDVEHAKLQVGPRCCWFCTALCISLYPSSILPSSAMRLLSDCHPPRCTEAFWTALQQRSRLWLMTWISRRKFGSSNVRSWTRNRWLEVIWSKSRRCSPWLLEASEKGYKRQMKVSWNRCTPKSSTLMGFSLINHPAMGVPPFQETPKWSFWKSNCNTFDRDSTLQKKVCWSREMRPSPSKPCMPLGLVNVPVRASVLISLHGFFSQIILRYVLKKPSVEDVIRCLWLFMCIGFVDYTSPPWLSLKGGRNSWSTSCCLGVTSITIWSVAEAERPCWFLLHLFNTYHF